MTLEPSLSYMPETLEATSNRGFIKQEWIYLKPGSEQKVRKIFAEGLELNRRYKRSLPYEVAFSAVGDPYVLLLDFGVTMTAYYEKFPKAVDAIPKEDATRFMNKLMPHVRYILKRHARPRPELYYTPE